MFYQRSRLWPITSAWWLCLSMIVLLPAGCGKKSTNGQVAGRVTIAGKPIQQGAVQFEHVKLPIGLVAEVTADGKYAVSTYKEDGLPPGDYRVAIRPDSPNAAPPVLPEMQTAAARSLVPPKYQNTATSGLQVTVKQGENPPFDFDLTP